MSIYKTDINGAFAICITEDLAFDEDLVRLDDINQDIFLCDELVDIIEDFQLECEVSYIFENHEVVMLFDNVRDCDIMFRQLHLLIN